MQPADETLPDPAVARSSAAGAKLPKLYRGRPWLAAAIAALVELIVIGAVDNQAVTRTLRKPVDDPTRVLADYSRGAIDAATAFWWRFAPEDGQATHVWAAQFAAIGGLVVVTWLGTLAVARGSVTFGRVWVGVWAVVAAAAPIGIVVRNVLVTPTAPGPAQSKVGQAIYGYDGFGAVIVAGLALGVVTGLVVAAVAAASRRHVAAAAPAARGFAEHDEYFDDTFAPRYGSGYEPQPQPYQPQPWGESQWATTQLPPVPAEGAPAPWPPAPPPAPWSPGPAAGPEAATQALPPQPPSPYGWREPQAEPFPPPQAEPSSPSRAEPSSPPRAEPFPPPRPESVVDAEPQPESGPEPQPEPEAPLTPGEQTQQLPRVPIDPDEDIVDEERTQPPRDVPGR